jgi:geranylgeranyl diphosphate synthase type I
LCAVNRYTDAILHITEGQHLDLSFEAESEVDEATYLTMIRGKTAALLGLTCELGGILAGTPEARLIALREFGVELGMAFQMQDDWLGLWGNPQQTGKPVGSDMRNRKKTLPILHGIAYSEAFRALMTSSTPIDDAHVAEGLALLETVGSQEYTHTQALAHHQKALAALARSEGTGEAQAALYALTEQLVGRTT